MTPPFEREPDFFKLRLRDESATDADLVTDTAQRFINAGAKVVLISEDADGDWLIEGWK
jgi:hypothetical protein